MCDLLLKPSSCMAEKQKARDGNLSLMVYCRALLLLVMTLMEEVGTWQHSSEGLKVSNMSGLRGFSDHFKNF